MKVEETLIIMSLFGALTHSTKLLKVPRIYNALVTSDENLQPSQAYPALAPVVQGIQYPVPSYASSNVYQMLVIPNQVQYSDTRSYTYSVHNSVKEDYYHYNIVETGRPFKFDIPKISSSTADEKGLEQQANLFRPVMPVQDENVLTVKGTPVNGNAARVDTNRIVYFESSPVQQDDDQQNSHPPTLNVNDHDTAHFQNPRQHNGEMDADVDTFTLPELNDEPSPAHKEDPKSDPRFNRLPALDEVVKNYRPKDTSIVDVPPPPVPVGRKSNKKPEESKVEEYPPPPVGFL